MNFSEIFVELYVKYSLFISYVLFQLKEHSHRFIIWVLLTSPDILIDIMLSVITIKSVAVFTDNKGLFIYSKRATLLFAYNLDKNYTLSIYDFDKFTNRFMYINYQKKFEQFILYVDLKNKKYIKNNSDKWNSLIVTDPNTYSSICFNSIDL